MGVLQSQTKGRHDDNDVGRILKYIFYDRKQEIYKHRSQSNYIKTYPIYCSIVTGDIPHLPTSLDNQTNNYIASDDQNDEDQEHSGNHNRRNLVLDHRDSRVSSLPKKLSLNVKRTLI